MTHQALIATLQAQGLHSILAQFCDIHGVAKGNSPRMSRIWRGNFLAWRWTHFVSAAR